MLRVAYVIAVRGHAHTIWLIGYRHPSHVGERLLDNVRKAALHAGS
jgi:hypothetical protein